MIITKFGDAYASAYPIPLLKGEHTWQPERPPIVTPVGGAAGVFDYYAAGNFPLAPLTITLRGIYKAASYAALEASDDVDELNQSRATTIALNSESKLWGEMRDDTIVWAWAKCIKFKDERKYGQGYTWQNMELIFYLPEGLWYGEEQNSIVATNGIEIETKIITVGNFPPLIDDNIVPGGPLIYFRVEVNSDDLDDSQGDVKWTSTRTATTSTQRIKTTELSAYNDNDVDLYAGDEFTFKTERLVWLTATPPAPQAYVYEIGTTTDKLLAYLYFYQGVGIPSPAKIDVEILSNTGHGYIAGDTVTIKGTNSDGVDGQVFTIDAGPGTFDFTAERADDWAADDVEFTYDVGPYVIRFRGLGQGGAISDATNATPIVITTANSHGLATGDPVYISDVEGNTAANGSWTITAIDGTSFSLDTSVGNGAYTADTGRWAYCTEVSAAATGANTAITTSVNHNLTTGDYVSIIDLDDIEVRDDVYQVTVVNATQFTIAEASSGAYVSGGFVFPEPTGVPSRTFQFYDTYVL